MSQETKQQSPVGRRLLCLLGLVLAAGAIYLGYLFSGFTPMLVLAAICIAVSFIGFVLAAKRRLVAPMILLTPIAVLLGYLFFWPTPFDPAAGPKRARSPAGTGVFAPNTALSVAVLLPAGDGPECVELDTQGRIYTGLQDGRIMRFNSDGDAVELANTGGRPLGLEMDSSGNLIVADSEKGLLSLTPEGTLTELTSEVDGRRMIFVDDLAIADDGKIYFSDASQHFRFGEHIGEFFERRPSGRLLVYDPAAKTTNVLMDKLYFANGVALAADQSFVIVVETYEHRIMRYWLDGPKAGTSDVFAENLPGFPDNVSEAPDGGFWLAIFSPRNGFLDSLVEQPRKRNILWRLGQIVGFPKPKHSYAVKISANGEWLQSMEDNTGHIYALTSVLERDGKLYLGSYVNDVIGGGVEPPTLGFSVRCSTN